MYFARCCSPPSSHYQSDASPEDTCTESKRCSHGSIHLRHLIPSWKQQQRAGCRALRYLSASSPRPFPKGADAAPPQSAAPTANTRHTHLARNCYVVRAPLARSCVVPEPSKHPNAIPHPSSRRTTRSLLHPSDAPNPNHSHHTPMAVPAAPPTSSSRAARCAHCARSRGTPTRRSPLAMRRQCSTLNSPVA